MGCSFVSLILSGTRCRVFGGIFAGYCPVPAGKSRKVFHTRRVDCGKFVLFFPVRQTFPASPGAGLAYPAAPHLFLDFDY